MRWIVIILYIVCFGCYVFFTRQPDYFDSERTSGTIIKRGESLVVAFHHDGATRYATVPYTFLHELNETVQVIYETSDISKAKLYAVIGYWITFGELIASLFIVLALYWVAVSVTRNPTPEALMEQLEMGKKKPRKNKYSEND